MKTRRSLRLISAVLSGIILSSSLQVQASSHREAPYITSSPKVDGSDFYAFTSYENGREDYVTMIANYLPLQDSYGGPNYFDLDSNAIYEIHVDGTGDAVEDLTFRFTFFNEFTDLQVDAGGTMVSVPLKNIGEIGPTNADNDNVQVRQTYKVDLIVGDRRTGTVIPLADADGVTRFNKPLDNIGNKSIPDYEAYANDHIYELELPDSCGTAKVFVGQRKEGFAVNLGEIFDLVNLNPLGAENANTNTLADKNVTSIAIEAPSACLTEGAETVIGTWTTASQRQARVLNPNPTFDSNRDVAVEGGAWTQVSRLGMPLVNEVVIGLKDKDQFNASEPKDDAQFATYVTNPSLPILLEALFGVVPPNLYPRTDLVAAFLTGVATINKPTTGATAEILRLNTATAPVAAASQDNLGVIGGDTAGFPNGRRPGDDVVDVALRVVMGALIDDITIAPSGELLYTDGATVDALDFDETFPYLTTPIAGSPQ
ncbi:MAG: DUF4331 domain-containing protein [Pseudomonadota bacterium]